MFLGATGSDVCPVALILSYMVLRGHNSGPFFRFSNGIGLTRDRFVSAVRSALDSAGYSSSLYAGHSFRIGAATTVAQCGIPDSSDQNPGTMAKCSVHSVHPNSPRDPVCSGPVTDFASLRAVIILDLP